MKHSLALLLILALCLFASAMAEESFVLGGEVPDFSVTLTDGTEVTLSGMLEDHDLVLINVWATWCGPCAEEFPYLLEAYEAYSDRTAVLCVSIEDSGEDIAAYQEENGLTALPMAEDTAGLTLYFATGYYPTTALVDRYGACVYCQDGSFSSVKQYTSLFDRFLGDDYTESEPLDGQPMIASEAEPESDEVLTAALTDGADIRFSSPGGAYEWPFVLGGDGVVSSNRAAYSRAALYAYVTASEGDALSFDYALDVPCVSDAMTLLRNGEQVYTFTGTVSGTYTVSLEEGGNELIWLYTAYAEPEADQSGTVTLSNARLLSGAAAEEALAALPVLPASLEGDASEITLSGSGVREIVFDDPSGIIFDALGDVPMYIASEGSALAKVRVGADIDASAAFVYDSYDRSTRMLPALETDDGGFLCLCPNAPTTYTFIKLYLDLGDTEGAYCVVFPNEDYVNTLVTEWLHYADGSLFTGASWRYADTDCEVIVTDENGAPVAGVKLSVCSDSLCLTGTTDESGVYAFEGTEFPYTAHVLSAPEGYTADLSREYTLERAGALTITVK